MEEKKKRSLILVSIFALVILYIITPKARAVAVSETVPRTERPKTLTSIDVYVLNHITHTDTLRIETGMSGEELREYLIEWAGNETNYIKMMQGDPETIDLIIEKRGKAYGTCHAIAKYWCYLVEKNGLGWAYYCVEKVNESISHAFGAVGRKDGPYLVIHFFYAIPGKEIIGVRRPFEICPEGVDISDELLHRKVPMGPLVIGPGD